MSAQQPPGYQPPRRTDTDAVLPQGTDRTEQLETMQMYESNKEKSTEDQDQETLAREFPKIDSTLIAALYSDSKNLGATREMLYALSQQEEGQ